MYRKYISMLGSVLAAVSLGLAFPTEAAQVKTEPVKVQTVNYKKDSPSWQAFCQKYKLNPALKGKRVIMDFDLTYLNDDFFALTEMLKLHQYGFIKLEGISIVGANSIVARCAYDTLSTLHELGFGDIPVYLGTDKPIKGLKKKEDITKHIGEMGYMGAYMVLDKYTRDWKSQEVKDITTCDDFLPMPELEPEKTDATTFLLETVKKYPGEVEIISLGGLMNVAKAIKKDPSFSKNCSGITIMGGVFHAHGEVLKNVEINWWFDPAAANIVSKADWKKILILPHDAATHCRKDLSFIKYYDGKHESKIIKLIKRDLPKAETYMPETTLAFFWDPIAVAALVCPDIIKKQETLYFAVQEEWGHGFGSTYHWTKEIAPKGVGKGDVILEVDGNLFYEFLTDLQALED